MIKLDFKYTDADWDKIKRVAEKGLDRKAGGARLRDKVLIRGRWHPALLFRLEMMVSLRNALAVRQSAEQSRARIRRLEALQHGTPRFEEKMVAALSTDFSHYGEVRRKLQPGVEIGFLDAAHSFIARLRANIDSALSALRYRTKSKSNASKRDRDLLWHEALQIWCELGGEPTGGDTADFLIAVSRPVFHAMLTNGRRKKGLIPDNRASVMEWLRRQEKARQAEAQEHENGDGFSSPL